MTWSDFVSSIYNVNHYIPYVYIYDKFTISANIIYAGVNGLPLSETSDVFNSISATDKIIPDKTYYRYVSDGGASN